MDRKKPLNHWMSWFATNRLEANLLLEPDPGRRVAATLKICGCLDRFQEDYSDDGACEEKPGYRSRTWQGIISPSSISSWGSG
jgi:hypothetical protein